jgi:hypothetical protein
MNENKVGYFTDSKGNPSSMRLNSHLALWMSFICAGLVAYTKYEGMLIVTVIFVVGAFAPKAVQKFAEMKIGG